jgi:flagellar protein FlbD
MIQLTRLNNHPLVINSDLIKSIESAPDTVLTLVTGEKIIVLESSDDVLEKIVDFRRRILSGLPIQPIQLLSPASRHSDTDCEASLSTKRA